MPTISPTEVSTGRHRLVDVRTPAEHETEHIAGSVNVPLDLLRRDPAALAEHLGPDCVLVCRSGARAEQAAQALAGAGLADLPVLAGGVQGWSKAGLPLSRGRERWDLERQVRLVAGTLVLGGVLASTVLPRAKWFSAAIGAGLTTAALTNTCAMGSALARLPYNRGAQEPTVAAAVERLRG